MPERCIKNKHIYTFDLQNDCDKELNAPLNTVLCEKKCLLYIWWTFDDNP